MTYEPKEDYPYRHWCPYSEPYTGCDSLLSLLDSGWSLEHSALLDDNPIGGRRIVAYHFFLRREDQFLRMTVVSSPYLEHLIKDYQLKIISHQRPETKPVLCKVR